MKIEIRVLNKEKNVVQITTPSERWYAKALKPDVKDMSDYKFVPSVTWIAGHYPKGIPFYRWLADKGWDEAEAIKQAAGNKGSKVHQAIGMYLSGERITMDAKLTNHDTGQQEELSVEEYDCLLSFTQWYATLDNPKTIATEITVFNDIEGYAGTVDWLVEIGGELWLIDFKTSQQVWPEYEIQVSAYKHATLPVEKAPKLGILQIGYKKNKNGWKFTEIEDKYDLFLSAKAIWANETAGEKPKQKDYPLFVELPKKKARKKTEAEILEEEIEERKKKLKELKKNG
jgi:hypothetical protein